MAVMLAATVSFLRGWNERENGGGGVADSSHQSANFNGRAARGDQTASMRKAQNAIDGVIVAASDAPQGTRRVQLSNSPQRID